MTDANVIIALLFPAFYILGFFMGRFTQFFGFKKKIQLVRDEKYADLKKIFDLTNNRSKTVTKELNEFVGFVNEELPKDITNIVISEPKLALLKSKSGVSDKKYLEALEPIILEIQRVIAERAILAVNNIAQETIKDMRGLIDVPSEKTSQD